MKEMKKSRKGGVGFVSSWVLQREEPRNRRHLNIRPDGPVTGIQSYGPAKPRISETGRMV